MSLFQWSLSCGPMDEFKHQQRINSILRDFLQHIFTHNFMILGIKSLFYTDRPEKEFNEFKSRFKSAKTQFKLTTGLNLETFDTMLSGTNHI